MVSSDEPVCNSSRCISMAVAPKEWNNLIFSKKVILDLYKHPVENPISAMA